MNKLIAAGVLMLAVGCGPDWIVPRGPTGTITVVDTTTDAGSSLNDGGYLPPQDSGTPGDAGTDGGWSDAGSADAGSSSDAGTLDAGTCDTSLIPSTGPVPSWCMRIEGSAIGSTATYSLGTGSVSFTAWTPNPTSSNYAGFAYTTSLNVGYAVKSGTEVDLGTTSPWLNPNVGLDAGTVYDISNVTMCLCGDL